MWTRTEALAEETGYLEGILQSSQDIIITTDLDSRIVQFNPGAENILGYSAEEMQGRPVSEMWEHAKERDEIMEKVRVTGGVVNYETRLKAKSGKILDISLTLSKLCDSDGKMIGTVGVSKDVSRELAIRHELENLNRSFRETINFISHESKNSLLVIGGFVHRLMKQETDPRKLEQLQIVYHHSKFLEAMSRDYLVMSMLEQGEFGHSTDTIEDLYEEVILPAMIGLRDRYPDSFDTYDSCFDGRTSVRVEGNRDLLETVFRNLFGNALKYRSKAGKIRFGIEEQGDEYILNVWNAGPGVPATETVKIFEKFYRVQDEDTQGKRGTGLGLYNIRRIVAAHGGRIWCETKPGESINFLFTLPKG